VIRKALAPNLRPYRQKTLTANQKSGLHRRMKKATIRLTLAFCFLAGTACLAADPYMGSWMLNEAKSKHTPGTGKNILVVYEDAMGGKVKITTHGVIHGTGKPKHTEWTGKFDGKDYSVSGDSRSDTRSYRKVDDRTLEVIAKKGGKVTFTGRVVVAADGKSRTVTVSGTDEKGKKFKNIAVFDKQ
jgi:hypothetical protein